MILRTEQFMGAVACSTLEQGKSSISFSDFYDLEKKVSKKICNADSDIVFCISKHDVFSIVEDNNSLFTIEGEGIKFLRDKGYYENYFLNYLPISISERLTNLVKEK